MKMTAGQIEVVKRTLGAEPVPEDNPAMEQLRTAFGDHSFYASEDGLMVFEPDEDGSAGGDIARLVMVAAWTDDAKNSLAPVEPRRTDITVDLTAVGDPPRDA